MADMCQLTSDFIRRLVLGGMGPNLHDVFLNNNGDLDDSFPEALNLEMTEDLRELCADYRRFFN